MALLRFATGSEQVQYIKNRFAGQAEGEKNIYYCTNPGMCAMIRKQLLFQTGLRKWLKAAISGVVACTPDVNP